MNGGGGALRAFAALVKKLNGFSNHLGREAMAFAFFFVKTNFFGKSATDFHGENGKKILLFKQISFCYDAGEQRHG